MIMAVLRLSDDGASCPTSCSCCCPIQQFRIHTVCGSVCTNFASGDLKRRGLCVSSLGTLRVCVGGLLSLSSLHKLALTRHEQARPLRRERRAAAASQHTTAPSLPPEHCTKVKTGGERARMLRAPGLSPIVRQRVEECFFRDTEVSAVA
jgi:hypothetical protein